MCGRLARLKSCVNFGRQVQSRRYRFVTLHAEFEQNRVQVDQRCDSVQKGSLASTFMIISSKAAGTSGTNIR